MEPHLKYCPQCGDEYRTEIVLCAACGLELVSGADIISAASAVEAERCGQGDGGVILEHDRLIALQRGGILDMKQLKNLLEKAAIPALLAKEDGCRGGCGGPEVLLQVREQDGERAVALLRKEFDRTTAINDYVVGSAEAVFALDSSRVLCPACNCEFTPDGPSCPDCGLCFL